MVGQHFREVVAEGEAKLVTSKQLGHGWPLGRSRFAWQKPTSNLRRSRLGRRPERERPRMAPPHQARLGFIASAASLFCCPFSFMYECCPRFESL